MRVVAVVLVLNANTLRSNLNAVDVDTGRVRSLATESKRSRSAPCCGW